MSTIKDKDIVIFPYSVRDGPQAVSKHGLIALVEAGSHKGSRFLKMKERVKIWTREYMETYSMLYTTVY